jgi:hypothetical protein
LLLLLLKHGLVHQGLSLQLQILLLLLRDPTGKDGARKVVGFQYEEM